MRRVQHTYEPLSQLILTIIVAVAAALLLRSCEDEDRFFGGRPPDGWLSQ